MSKIKFGDQVLITKKYRRHKKEGLIKEYLPENFKSDGIFLGLRTITNGYSECWGNEPCYWMATESFRVGLVIINERENPVYVPIDSITLRT